MKGARGGYFGTSGHDLVRPLGCMDLLTPQRWPYWDSQRWRAPTSGKWEDFGTPEKASELTLAAINRVHMTQPYPRDSSRAES